MSMPVSEVLSVLGHILRHRLAGRKHFPLVLMLEPLYRCNLSCAGCGKIQYPERVLKHQLSVEECMHAVDECPTPVVSIPGGEPLLHPQIKEIVEGLVTRKRYIHLCTNALLLERKLHLFEPSKYLTFTVHLDGLEPEHDRAVCREGVHRKAVRAIRAALDRGFRVTTNTTLFDDADPERTAAFFDAAMDLGIEGIMVSPGYEYAKAPDQQNFLKKERTRDLFRRVLSRPGAKRWKFIQSPLFVEFLAGRHDFDCTPWGMPTYSVFGWQKPCYLLQEGYEERYDALIENTRWEDYGPRSGNPACQNCMVHSGFEASAVLEGFSSFSSLFRMGRAFLFGPDIEAPSGERVAPAARPDGPPAPTQGFRAPASEETLALAFDYRGDVTLTLDDDRTIEGFVANAGDILHIWPIGETTPVKVPSSRVKTVLLSGQDPAVRSSLSPSATAGWP